MPLTRAHATVVVPCSTCAVVRKRAQLLWHERGCMVRSYSITYYIADGTLVRCIVSFIYDQEIVWIRKQSLFEQFRNLTTEMDSICLELALSLNSTLHKYTF